MKTLEQVLYRILPTGGVTAPRGFKAAGIHAGIKRKRLDVGLLYSEVPAAAAGVYTTNLVRAACVDQNEEQLKSIPYLQAILVNSGNANACTGMQGVQDALEMRNRAARALGVCNEAVAIASTGVIGVPLPMEKLNAGIEQVVPLVNQMGGEEFARAILTTDTFVKEVAVQLTIDSKTITIGGVAKGSGMVHPNMATMLAFLTTDAAIEPAALKRLLGMVTDRTYNRITVDGDTSTNDMVLVMANGLAGNEVLSEAHPEWPLFAKAFRYASEKLAKDIARDGEGATRLVEVVVKGGLTEAIAGAIAKSIVGSSLVKTAVYGADANWGRILCAAGYAGAPFDPKQVDVWIGDAQVAQRGMGLAFDEEQASAALQADPVVITVDLHMGDETATAYGCDLTYDYVRINASYRS